MSQKGHDMFELLKKDSADDDTTSLFSGSLDECHAYAQGFAEATLQHSGYMIVIDAGEGTLFHSRLVSESDFRIWIDKVPQEEIEEEQCPCIVCTAIRNGADEESAILAVCEDEIYV